LNRDGCFLAARLTSVASRNAMTVRDVMPHSVVRARPVSGRIQMSSWTHVDLSLDSTTPIPREDVLTVNRIGTDVTFGGTGHLGIRDYIVHAPGSVTSRRGGRGHHIKQWVAGGSNPEPTD